MKTFGRSPKIIEEAFRILQEAAKRLKNVNVVSSLTTLKPSPPLGL